MLQEETLRWSERERKAQAEKLAELEHDLQAATSERRATQVCRGARFLLWPSRRACLGGGILPSFSPPSEQRAELEITAASIQLPPLSPRRASPSRLSLLNSKLKNQR